MPGAPFYDGLSLPEKLLKLAEHHADPLVRHISQEEASILKRAAEAANGTGSAGRVARLAAVGGLVLAGAAVAYGKHQTNRHQEAPSLQSYVGQEVTVTVPGGPDGEQREVAGVLKSVADSGIVLRDQQGQEEFLALTSLHVRDSDGRTIFEGP